MHIRCKKDTGTKMHKCLVGNTNIPWGSKEPSNNDILSLGLGSRLMYYYKGQLDSGQHNPSNIRTLNNISSFQQ